MKRASLIAAVLIGMFFATASPAHAIWRRGLRGYGHYGPSYYGAYYRPYGYGRYYAPRAYSYYGGYYPGYYGAGVY